MPGDSTETELPLIERFTRALAWILHEERPDALVGPITVAELYQDIAPYRRMRVLAGIEIHADYEHALIRLLSGEGGFARLDPDSARDALAVEAEAIDPDLSAYRRFAACEVWLSPGEEIPSIPVRPVLPPPPAEPLKFTAPPEDEPDETAVDELDDLDELEARAELEEREELEQVPLPPSRDVASAHEIASALAATGGRRSGPAAGSGAAQPSAAAPTTCAFCGQRLPQHREIRYCPHCGGDQTARQCAACGERLEDDWRYCIACGTPAEV